MISQCYQKEVTEDVHRKQLLRITGVPKSSQINLDGQNPCKVSAEEFIFSKVADFNQRFRNTLLHGTPSSGFFL